MTSAEQSAKPTTGSSGPASEPLLAIAAAMVDQAQEGEHIEVACGHSVSTAVKVYGGEVESFTTAENHAIGVRVLRDGREGFASAGTLDREVVEQTLADARDNATYASVDSHAGLATPDDVPAVDIDLWRDEVLALSAQAKIAIAIELEKRVLGSDDRITGVRVASYGDGASAFALASTMGIRAEGRATSSGMSVQALAADGDRTQTGGAYDGARAPDDLDIDHVVERAVSQAVDLIGAQKPKTKKVSLVLDPHQAATVLGLISGTLTGDRIIKKRSPFIDRLGETIASPLLTMLDNPTDPDSLGADSHDGEGLACRENVLISNGVLEGFLYDAYTGRRAGTGSTGSAVRGTRGLPSPGVQALSIAAGAGGTLDDLIASVDNGVLVFSLAGLHSGVNPVSGDFSVGVEGRVIRDGELAEPISECTVSSTLQRLLLDVESVGSDRIHLASGVSTPSVVVGDMMLSGASN